MPLAAELVPGLVDALDHLRASAAVDRELDLSALARQLAGGGPLRARRDLLGELLAVAIDEAGERVALGSAALLRRKESAAELRAALRQLVGLLELWEWLEA